MYVIRGDKTENVCCHGDDLLTPRTQNTCIVAVINGTIIVSCCRGSKWQHIPSMPVLSPSRALRISVLVVQDESSLSDCELAQ